MSLKHLRMLRYVMLSILIPVVLGGQTTSAGDEDSSNKDAQLKDVPCSKEITSVLDQWSVERTWTRELNQDDGTRVDRSPTNAVGVWLETKIHKDQSVDILRVTAHTTTKVSWDKMDKKKFEECVPTLTVINRNYDPTLMKKSFTDTDLEETLKNNDSGVIYVWSPHMVLSLQGIKNIRTATDKLGVKLILVLDPHANKKYAVEMADKYKLKHEALRPLESIELFNRGVGEHYPVIQVFAKGKIAGPTIPGYKTAEFYETFIKGQIKP